MEVLLSILGVTALAGVGALAVRLLVDADRLPTLLERAVESRAARRRSREPIRLGRPLEEIAHEARRLGRAFHALHTGLSYAKQEAVRRAYDDVLAEACRALGVADWISDLPPGDARDLARQHVEHALEEAGMVLRERH
ncbi:hypothetical protein GCM10027425_16870 [Alteromonas gracilis]